MTERVQAQRPAPQRRDETPAEPAEQVDTTEAKAKVDEADDLLDEIDALLDTTEQLVTYTQKGGQ